MKTTPNKPHPASTPSLKPFFSKNGEGDFFPPATEAEQAFFSPSTLLSKGSPAAPPADGNAARNPPLQFKPAAQAEGHIARDTTASAEHQRMREHSVRSAMSFIDAMRGTVASDRRMARSAAMRARGLAEASRQAHPLLNQQIVRSRLERGRRVYDAQRSLLHADHPLQGELRETYARFLEEVREAFDEALQLAENDRQAQIEEQTAYGESMVLWMEASPFQTEALAGRSRFTAADVRASQIQDRGQAAALGSMIPLINLVQPGMPARARAAISSAQSRVAPQGSGAPQRSTASSTAQADALSTLQGAERTINQGRSLLRQAVGRLNTWLQAPTQPIDVAGRVDELFHTRDAGYGRLLRGRLQLMLTNLEGNGALFAHIHQPDDTSVCSVSSILGEVSRPYEFVFCGQFNNLDSDTHVLLHETAHAVIPGRGTRQAVGTDFPLDRAYAGERLMRRMTTEEALNNAESYAELIAVLAGAPVQPTQTDTVSGCADDAPILDAMARAQSAHRRAWIHLQQARNQLRSGGAVEASLRALINTHLGSPPDAELLVMLEDFGRLQGSGTAWHRPWAFSCATARQCPTGALAFDSQFLYSDGRAQARRRRAVRDVQLCPAFFNLNAENRARVAYMIVSVSAGASFLQRPGSVWGYAGLALALYQRDFGAPPASSLPEHQAADRAAAP